jgi:hypothetical protein
LSKSFFLSIIPASLRPIIFLKHYYIYARALDQIREPRLHADFDITIISNFREYCQVIQLGLDFSPYPKHEDIESALNSGSILIGVFKGHSLVHTTWIATDSSSALYDSIFLLGKVGNALDSFIGPCNTYNPYRGRGIYPEVLISACHYLQMRGFKRVFINTKASNIASIRGIKKAHFERVGSAWKLWLFGFQFSFFNPRSKSF